MLFHGFSVTPVPSVVFRCAFLVAFLFTASADACPFCDVVGRPLAVRRDAATTVAIGEASGEARDDGGMILQAFVVRSVLGKDAGAIGETVTARVAGPVDGTALLLASGEGPDPKSIEAIAADEMLLGYALAAPPTEARAAERLRWFARWLEHPNRSIAEDAFMEFGLAHYDDVVQAADALDAEKLRRWLDEPAIDQRRRGFYGLALGIVAARARARGDRTEADACLGALAAAIAAPADDLRPGYDGLLGGLLVARGEGAIDAMIDRGLLASDTRAGDARHALAALRFAFEFLGKSVPRERVAGAAARLVANPAVAAAAIVDLARYEHWQSVEDVAALWKTLGRDDPLVRRAVAGYLIACPLPQARQRADAIAAASPETWAAAVQAAGLPPRSGT
jgi:hypothetical protein